MRSLRGGQVVDAGAHLPFLLRRRIPFAVGRGDIAAGFPLETTGGQGTDGHFRNEDLQYPVAQKHFARPRS